MGRLGVIFLLCLQPLAAFARCEGEDLIAVLPPGESADLAATVRNMPHATGLLWRARRGDTVLTVFGTYHFRHRDTGAQLDRLAPLIADAEAVYLEISNDDQARLERDVARDPSIMFITEGETLPDLLGEEDWDALSDAMKARGIPSFVAAKFKPVWAAMMLGIGPCEARNGVMEGRGIDSLIGAHAAEAGTPVHSLEDYRALLTKLDSDPIAKQLDMIRLFFDLPIDADDMAHTLRQRYLDQQTGLILAWSRQIMIAHGGAEAQADYDRFEEDMLIERNRAWLRVLVDEAAGQTALVAVGAGHLPGETGLLHLLESDGFEITRLDL